MRFLIYINMKEQCHPERPNYTEEELEYRDMVITKAEHANNQRSQRWIELDDMDYESWYWRAKKANEAYIEPKRNKEDVKVVTGTTREKTNILVATLLNYNLEVDITAFDDTNVTDIELGRAMEAMVRKSRTLELPSYEEKRSLAYKELVGQGNVFVEEQYIEYSVPDKELEDMNWSEDVDPRKIKWREKLSKVQGICNSSVLTGLDVFPGNMREFFIELQPYMILRRRLSRAEAEMRYGSWKRFKYVPYELTNLANTDDEDDYNDFQMIETEVDFVEEIRYMNKWTNEYMVMLNGVLMLPIKFPLSALIGVSEYPISKGDSEPISRNFFYSRGVGAKTRMDQALIDEMFKMMVVKTRKSYKPPMANRSQFTVGADIYLPGKIFKGLDPSKIEPIGDNNGVTPAEFNMTQFVKGIIDGKTLAPIMEGQAANKGATAREVVEQKQQSMIKIGMPMLGIINLEKRIGWLRIYNILRNWTRPIDKKLEETKEGVMEEVDVYRTVDIEDEFETGQKGRKVIEMTEGELPSTEQILAEEEISEKIKGEKVRKTYINPKVLRGLKYKWHVEIEPTEKNTGMLKAAKFEEMAQKLITMFAPLGKMPNLDYLGDRIALLNDESPDKMWEQPQQPPGMPGMPPGPPGAPGGQPGQPPIPSELAAQLTGGGEQPNLSLNTLMNQ
jgi:hypothetical protein